MSPTVELYSPEFFADPYAYYGRLRETDPVHWYPPEDAELVAVTDAVHVEEFIQMDPPEHTGRRAAVSPRFAPSVLERWRPVVRQIIGDLRRNGSPGARPPVPGTATYVPVPRVRSVMSLLITWGR